jgi:uroporphyrinogen-III synthase
MASILVVRQFDDFSRILAENNFEVINCPAIKTVPLTDLSDFEKKLKTLDADYDGIFLTSKTATEIFCRVLSEENIKFGGKIYVLGRRSFELLRGSGNLNLVFCETAATAREMMDAIAPEDLKNKRLLFIRGEKSLNVVPDFLKKQGAAAAVDETIVYRTNEITIANDKIEEIRKSLANGEIVAACFFSPSGAASFLRQFGGEVLRQTKIAVIGKTTAEFFEKQNLTVDFVSPKASAKDFAAELSGYLKKSLPANDANQHE